jgi:hypothetical protein
MYQLHNLGSRRKGKQNKREKEKKREGRKKEHEELCKKNRNVGI